LEGLSLANHKSALKRIRTSERRRQRNHLVISSTRTAVKKARLATQPGSEPQPAREAIVNAIRTLDKAANKGILHKNNVARRKSRLMKRLLALEASNR
jgi:small subunit ribosomal protein S20